MRLHHFSVMRPGVALTTAAVAACTPQREHAAADREAREAMLFTIASQFRESAQAIEVVDFSRVTWRDACLEIRRRGECARTRTPGYRLRIQRRGAA
jgi:hypothetical protein